MPSMSSSACPGLVACVCALLECGNTLRLAQTSVLLTQQAGACAFPTCLEKKRKGKTTPFGVKLMRSQVLYRAAQVPV